MTPATPLEPIRAELLKRFGEAQKERLDRGLSQVAALWKKEDGDLLAFAKEHFVSDPAELQKLFARFESNLELVDGHMLEIGRGLRTPVDLDLEPMLPVDPLFASFDASAHLNEDFFGSKLAFVALLNFPLTTLEERLAHGKSYSRAQWAQARLTGRFSSRIPAEVQQYMTQVSVANDLYISSYNLWMHHLVDEKGARPFPKGKRLISHWNLRDELKSAYADQDGPVRQRMIVKLMERIVTQTIPAAVIDNPRVDWNPFTNQVSAAPASEVEENAPTGRGATAGAAAKVDGAREPDTRYERLWANFEAARRIDPYVPIAPTHLDRAFALGAEMPEARVKALLTEVLESPLVKDVAAEIERRLGRKLEPQELWYNGFVARGSISEAKLDEKTRARYPTAAAFAKDMPRILKGLGFSAEKAKYLSERIVVDPSRGAGHAMQAARRGDFPHLRTRVEKNGMNYKGYNIAVHELGHNVEQVFSLYGVDHTLLAGVPNTAFTEAMAFVFQARDLELLGFPKPDAAAQRMRVLADFWATWEIAGVALVDLTIWHWMYEHPKATKAELREAAVAAARDVWNRYYAPVLGQKDLPLLGIYSHMITNPIYLFNYPLGHLIAFQIEEQIEKTGKVGPEIERMAKIGAIAPDLWMEQATGNPVGAGALLRATRTALDQLKATPVR